MKICCVSDLHGYYPKTKGGDLLIVAGDLTGDHSRLSMEDFFNWLNAQEFTKKIMIAGNHDNLLEHEDCSIIEEYAIRDRSFEYLCDSGTTFEGMKIWGSPWSLWFYGINPYCRSFTGSESELRKKYALIPDDTNILITHSPPHGIFDKTAEGDHVGSYGLREALDRVRPILHVFGHIHECGGKRLDCVVTEYINASHVNRAYEPVNLPIYVDI